MNRIDIDEMKRKDRKEREERLAAVPLELRKEFRQRRRPFIEEKYKDLIYGCFGGRTPADDVEEELDELFGEDSR